MAGFNPGDLARLGIAGIMGSGTKGIGGLDIGSVATLMNNNKEAGGGHLDPALYKQALNGQLVWNQNKPFVGQSQLSSLADPSVATQPAVGAGGLDPISKFQQDIQNSLSKTSSPLGYQYFRQAATADPTRYGSFLNYGGVTNPYVFTADQWKKYGGGADQTSSQGGINAYINMTNDLYSQLQTKLGRVPSPEEVFAAAQHGIDPTYDAASNGNTDFFSRYSQLFI